MTAAILAAIAHLRRSCGVRTRDELAAKLPQICGTCGETCPPDALKCDDCAHDLPAFKDVS